MWCQIVIHYNKRFVSNLKTRVEAGFILRGIIKTLRFISRRAFYLFEMGCEPPHNFVSFELKKKSLAIVGEIYSRFLDYWLKGEKIARVEFRRGTKDWKNGEYFLQTISAHCNSLADNYDSFLKQQPNRKKGLKGIHHLVHCLMNATFGIREIETKLYKDMYKWYSKKPLSTLRKK